jgi:hypothetical protein
VTFALLLSRLRELLREKVRNGHLTERGMARATGVSQPHLHNVLKGVRTLPPDLADLLLSLAELDLANLMESATADWTPPSPKTLTKEAKETPNNPPELSEETTHALTEFPAQFLSADATMEPRFQHGDVVYYRQSTVARSAIHAKAAYLVSFNGRILVRYLRMGAQRLYLVSEDSLEDPIRWDYVSLADRHILEVVRGRIVWICRKMEAFEADSPEEIGGDD